MQVVQHGLDDVKFLGELVYSGSLLDDGTKCPTVLVLHSGVGVVVVPWVL